MQRIKSMIQLFLKEPLSFKLLISFTLLTSIILSSSFFSDMPLYQSISKLAAAIFFCAYGFKLRMNRLISILFFTVSGICIYLAFLALR
jgi:hypothetical protein